MRAEDRRADGVPELLQFLDALLRGVSSDQGCVDRTDRNAGYPVGMQVCFSKGLITLAW